MSKGGNGGGGGGVGGVFDSSLEPLLAKYIRGVDGAGEVLQDALLERAMKPFPISLDAIIRLEQALGVLTMDKQTKLASSVVRRFVPRLSPQLAECIPDLNAALSFLDEASNTTNDDDRAAMRQRVFSVWNACGQRKVHIDATRTAWAVWMLMRGMPLVALRTVRSIDQKELPAQIDLIASALGG